MNKIDALGITLALCFVILAIPTRVYRFVLLCLVVSLVFALVLMIV
jgi:hypothetical protein